MIRIQIILFCLVCCIGSVAQSNHTYQLALLKYNGGGDWYSNPTSIPNLVKFCNENGKMNINPEVAEVHVGDFEINNYPFIHMTGHGNVVFNNQEAENLRKYLIAGGFLHIDDNYGMDKFIRPQLKKVFPNLPDQRQAARQFVDGGDVLGAGTEARREMVAQIGADTRKVMDAVDSLIRQRLGISDTRQLQKLRRVDGPAGHNHLAICRKCHPRAATPAAVIDDACGALVLDQDPGRLRVGDDMEVPAMLDRVKEGPRGADPPPPLCAHADRLFAAARPHHAGLVRPLAPAAPPVAYSAG